MQTNEYLKYLSLPYLFGTDRTKEILSINPTVLPERPEAKEVIITVASFSPATCEIKQLKTIDEIYTLPNNNDKKWINIDGLRKIDVESICQHYSIHPLFVEDVLSINQRPKFDEVGEVMICLLNMLSYNEVKQTVEQEQLSICLGKDFLITFQEDATHDAFAALRDKLSQPFNKIKHRSLDYLCYIILDLIIDNYFLVMEKISEWIEALEEDVIRKSNTRSLAKINQLRKELIVLKRNTTPVRDLVANIIRSDSDLLDDNNTQYFKDVHDHIVQAIDICENYRDMIMSVQDLYLNNVNLKTNEVMKVMAIVTCLLAPATVIGGIFGMNFDQIPYLHNQYGFWIAVGLMLVVPIVMIFIFRRRRWF